MGESNTLNRRATYKNWAGKTAQFNHTFQKFSAKNVDVFLCRKIKLKSKLWIKLLWNQKVATRNVLTFQNVPRILSRKREEGGLQIIKYKRPHNPSRSIPWTPWKNIQNYLKGHINYTALGFFAVGHFDVEQFAVIKKKPNRI